MSLDAAILRRYYSSHLALRPRRVCIGQWGAGYAHHNLSSSRLSLITDIGTDLWLWLSFLRTGRADVFRLAYAMTRHLSEVDSHHSGPHAGLGSRHNVSHWGDGAKEARVSGAWLRRPFYYLTGSPSYNLSSAVLSSTLASY